MRSAKIILASSSKYRQQLLQRLQMPFTCDSPEIDESPLINETAEALVHRLAISKATAIANKHAHSNTLVIGSDQVASFNGKILTKPGNFERAHEQLSQCSGNSITFLTGLCLLDCNTLQAHTVIETFTVHFRELTQQQISHYLHKEQPYDCAGSFKMEGLGISLFKKLEGDDPNSLIGLPLIQLNNLLLEAGVDVLAYQ